VDDAAGVDASVRHLITMGHRQIALLIGPDRFAPSPAKIAAFSLALADQLGVQDAEPHVFRTL
jgi:DNA-binding LacI/PurR family transcriptional regulator